MKTVPKWIMQGTARWRRGLRQLPERPTIIFLQAGVGSMAGAITRFFSALYARIVPLLRSLSPIKQTVLFRTAQANDRQAALCYRTDGYNSWPARLRRTLQYRLAGSENYADHLFPP
jgi:threonine dehydratase